MGEYLECTLKSNEWDYLIDVLESFCEYCDDFDEIEKIIGLINLIRKFTTPVRDDFEYLKEFTLFVKGYADEHLDGSELDYDNLTETEERFINDFMSRNIIENDSEPKTDNVFITGNKCFYRSKDHYTCLK